MKNPNLIGLIISLLIIGFGALFVLFPQRFYSAKTPEQEALNRKYYKITGYIAVAFGVIGVVRDLLRLL